MKKIVYLFIALLFAVSSFANQEVYKIKVKINGIQDTTLLLGHHFGSKKFIVDTVVLDKKGAGEFIGDSLLHGGVYLLVLPDMSYFEILIDKDQEFSVATDTTDLLKNLQFSGSDLNTNFKNYQMYMSENHKKSAKIRDAYKRHNEQENKEGISKKEKTMHADSAKIFKDQLIALDEDVKKEWDRVIKENEGTVLASLLQSMIDIEVPEPPKDENGVITDSLFQYKYYKEHYFDNVRFDDPRLLRTPILESKIESYLKRAVVQHPDSLVIAADFIIKTANKNEEVYKFVLQHLFNKYNDTKIMCMDKIFVHIAGNYYLSGKAPWAIKDTAFLNKLYDRYMKMKDNVCGIKATQLLLQDTLGKIIPLHSIDAKYTVVYFYDFDCGHCKKTMPQWGKIAEKYDPKIVASYLVCTQIDKEKWKNFINKYNLGKLINVYDPTQRSNFRIHYDIYSSPVAYVLDENKEILAKRLSPEVIEEFLDKMIEHDAKKEK